MLQFVDEVYALFRQYIDESDKTFITDADASRYLSLGYNEFRRKVSMYDPYFYGSDATLNLSNADDVDLAAGGGAIMGSTATVRVSQITSVSMPDPTTGEPMSYLIPVGNAGNRPSCGIGYYIRNTIMHFTSPVTGQLRIDFVPVSRVDWTKTTTTPPREWIDELVEYHDIIALMACHQYFIRDARTSAEISKQIQRRLEDLQEYLSAGRDIHANKQMISVADPVGWSAYG